MRRRRAAAVPFALPWDVATTAQLCAVSPLGIAAGLGESGPMLGVDRLAGGRFHFDLIAAYHAGLIQGPNMLISGAGAAGKSALAKTYLHRTTALAAGGRPRWSAVLDPKGEWAALGHHLGYAVLRLEPGGHLRVNPLDTSRPAPGPAIPPATATRAPGTETLALAARPAALDNDDEVGVLAGRRAAVLETLLAVALDRTALDPSQQRLLVETARAHPTPRAETRPHGGKRLARRRHVRSARRPQGHDRRRGVDRARRPGDRAASAQPVAPRPPVGPGQHPDHPRHRRPAHRHRGPLCRGPPEHDLCAGVSVRTRRTSPACSPTWA